jgi:hypothetical protein
MPTRSWEDLLSDAGDASGGFETLPEGDYDFVVKEATAKAASTGKQMYVIKAEIQGGPHNSRLVWHNFVLTPDNPQALGFFFRNMATLGLTADYFKANPADHHVAEALIGRRFRGQVGIRKWQGQDRNEIKAFFPAAGAGVGAPPQAQVAAPAAPPAPPAAPAPPPPAPPVPPAAYQAPPAAAAPTPPPPPPAPPAPAPVEQAPTPPVAVEVPAEQVAPPAPPPLPAAPPAPAAPAAPEPAMAGAAANGEVVPPPPPF